MSYEEFKESKKSTRYLNGTYKCIMCGKVLAFWEVGDSRYYCPACEEHSRIKDDYDMYCKSVELKGLHYMRQFYKTSLLGGIILCYVFLSVDDGYIEINGNIIAIVHNKEDATEIEVNDFISTVKSIKESTGISDEIDMDFNDNVGKVKMSMDDFFKQCTACGGNWALCY